MAAGTRRVRRRYTRSLCVPPWLQRPTDERGRSVLSNVKDPVCIQNPSGDVLELGLYDLLYRTYRHSGVSREAVAPGEVIRYFQYEWEEINRRGVEWIEFVHPTTGRVARIDINQARRYGSYVDSNWGPMWAIPIDHYEGNQP